MRGLKRLHDEFMNAVDENQVEEVNSNFVRGFKLGLRLAIECFEK